MREVLLLQPSNIGAQCQVSYVPSSDDSNSVTHLLRI